MNFWQQRWLIKLLNCELYIVSNKKHDLQKNISLLKITTLNTKKVEDTRHSEGLSYVKLMLNVK